MGEGRWLLEDGVGGLVCWRRENGDEAEREERRRRTMVEEGSGVSKAAGVR